MFDAKKISEALQKLQQEGLYRESVTVENHRDATVTINRKQLVNFCSNDYLALSKHPAVVAAAEKALIQWGLGSGSAPLLSGYTHIHEELERAIAEFKGHEAAILFPSGFSANVGILPAIVDENDTVIIDRLCHASLIDGARLSKGKLQVYPHNDIEALEKVLQNSTGFAARWIVTDALFSMDGDLAPLPAVLDLAKHYQAGVVVDDAHGTGVLGKYGRGLEEEMGQVGQCDLVMGTFSKALGSLGGFAVGKKMLIDYLRNRARSCIFSTSSPPAVVAGALAALHIIDREPNRVTTLRNRSRSLRAKLTNVGITPCGWEYSPIIPIVIGDVEPTRRAADAMRENGFFLSAIRPPTVPKDESRLRLSVTLHHKTGDLDDVAKALAIILEPSESGISRVTRAEGGGARGLGGSPLVGLSGARRNVTRGIPDAARQ